MVRYSRNLICAPKNSFVVEPPSNPHRILTAFLKGIKWDELTPFGQHEYRTYDTLLKAIERRGHQVEHAEGYLFPAWFVIHGERVDFRLRECMRRPRVPLTPKELRDHPNIARKRNWKYVDVWTGLLIMEARAEYRGIGSMRWSEKPDQPLEEQIDEIALKLEAIGIEAAEERAQDRREEERYERRQAERLRSYRVEKIRWKAICETVAAWEKAERLRCFIDAVVQLAPRRTDQVKRLNKWLRWAQPRVDKLDPFTKDFDSILTGLGMKKR